MHKKPIWTNTFDCAFVIYQKTKAMNNVPGLNQPQKMEEPLCGKPEQE